MRVLLCGLLIFGLLSAQPRQDSAPVKLIAALTGLQDPTGDRASASLKLTDAMMALSPLSDRPARSTVAAFASEFAGGVWGRKLSTAQLIGFQSSIVKVMRGTTANFSSAQDFRNTLEALRLFPEKEQAITTKFMAIGEEVRGPDDAPAKDKFPKK